MLLFTSPSILLFGKIGENQISMHHPVLVNNLRFKSHVFLFANVTQKDAYLYTTLIHFTLKPEKLCKF